MLELIINGIFIGMGTAIGTLVFELRVRPWLVHANDIGKIIKEMKNEN